MYCHLKIKIVFQGVRLHHIIWLHCGKCDLGTFQMLLLKFVKVKLILYILTLSILCIPTLRWLSDPLTCHAHNPGTEVGPHPRQP